MKCRALWGEPERRHAVADVKWYMQIFSEIHEYYYNESVCMHSGLCSECMPAPKGRSVRYGTVRYQLYA